MEPDGASVSLRQEVTPLNLRDKLRAINTPKKPKPEAPVQRFTDCWKKETLRSLDEFPRAFDLKRETVMLMQGEELPSPLDPARILYLDTETTGLAGGAGTVAFEVGVGFLTEGGFVIRQYVMRDYPEEKFMLRELEALLEDFDVICTFNGKTFDLPLLRDRFLMNRMDPDCLDLPHIDLLHIARRVWKLRLKRCNLSRLEELVLGMPRLGDLPGSEAPQRYFTFLRTGEFGLLYEVLTHNEQDIASLCVLLNHMSWLYEHPEQAAFGEDVFSMGTALEKLHHPEEARKCYRLVTHGSMRAQGQLRLAASYRRAGSRSEARQVWLDMIARREGGVTPYIELAKHYEHAERDIPAALDMTRRAIARMAEPTLFDDPSVQATRNALQYRYDRLKRRLAAKGM